MKGNTTREQRSCRDDDYVFAERYAEQQPDEVLYPAWMEEPYPHAEERP